MEQISPLFNAILGSAGAAFFGLLLLAVKWLFAVKKNIGTMVENGKNRAEETRALFRIQEKQCKVQEATLQAVEATLEVVGKNLNNGNVDKAMDKIKEGRKSLGEADDIFKDTMLGKIGFQEIVEVKK